MNQKALGQFLMQPSTADVLDTPVRRGGILPVTEYPNRSEFDLTSGLTGALWNALTAPARAARGEISEAEQIPEAFNFAGSLTLGSLLAPRPTGSVGMGGGPTKKQFREYLNKKFPFNPSENNRRGSSGNYGQRGADYGDYLWRNDKGQFDFEYAEWLKKQGNDGGSELSANAKTGAAVPLATKALEAQQPQGIRAFHGSPHDFDKFSMEHIGKGEGAQAYGHGLYFAEAEDVARSYRENLTRGARTGSGPGRIDVFTVDGVEVPASQKSVADIAHMMREYSIDPNTADGLDWLQREVGARGLPFETIEQAANLYKRDIARNTVDGRMYEVNIKADPEDFLDWDKPLSQQSEKVRAALEAQGFKSDRDAIKSFDDALYAALMDDSTPAVLPKQPPDPLGSDIVRKMHAQRGSQWLDPNKTGEANASQSLREAGIPGIRYLDQMSRGEGKGSSNYVVFDDNLIEILRKYGLLGPVAGGGTLAGMLMGGQEGETY